MLAAAVVQAQHALCILQDKADCCSVIRGIGLMLFSAGQAAGVAVIIGVAAGSHHPESHPT